ncbi:MAG: zf-TFIIB domain-containing protein [Ignavibacteriaceae bacterium]
MRGTDNNELKTMTREGFGINYCPVCKGIWLARGELNRIIEKAKSLEDGENKPKRAEIERIKESRVGYQTPGHFFGQLFNV